jgi:uncharacterized protein
MKILFDFVHPADVNFFKNSIEILDKKGIETILVFRERESLSSILKEELPSKKALACGIHHNSLFGKGVSFISRNIILSYYRYNDNNIDIFAGFSFFSSIPSKFSRTTSLVFGDDPEYALTYYISKFSSNYFVLPSYVQAKGNNIIQYDGFKELAYLHPKYFKPNLKSLEQYNLKPDSYVFIRMVSKTSLNYRYLPLMDLQTICSTLNALGLRVLLSIEDKNLARNLAKYCVILKEPVTDIFSLLKFALFTISSGDTMARESCLLGTPSIYIGGRDMKINQELIKKSCMFKVSSQNELNKVIKEMLNNDVKNETKKTIDFALRNEWVDTTSLIVELFLTILNKNISFLNKHYNLVDQKEKSF